MNPLNSIIIEGNVCREVEVKQTSNGYQLSTFPIAVNRYHKKEDGSFEQETSYFDIEAWGEIAKSVKEKSYKGCGVRVVGRLKQNRWTDADGKNQSRISVVAEHIEFMNREKKNKGSDVFQNKENEAAAVIKGSEGFDLF